MLFLGLTLAILLENVTVSPFEQLESAAEGFLSIKTVLLVALTSLDWIFAGFIDEMFLYKFRSYLSLVL